ncbi:unnamed protein product [Brassica oleracea]
MCTKIKYNLYTVCVIDFSFLIYMQLMINIYFFFFFDNPGVPRFTGHSPGPGQAAVHFTREGYTWAGSNPVPLWCPEEAE